MLNVTSPKVAIPVLLFIALSPTIGLNTTNVNIYDILFRSLLFLITYTVIARALDFGSPGEQNYECAMAIVNHELRKQQPEMNMSNWFDMMEAVRGDS